MHASLRTLIVDDNSTNRHILARTLKHHFSLLVDVPSIVQAADGFRALRSYREQQFDMILLDIDMPGMSGVEVAEEIRRSDKDTIIIACTTSDSPASRALYRKVGMDGCVCKPLDLRELTDCMLRSLESREPLKLALDPLLSKSNESFFKHMGSPPTRSVPFITDTFDKSPYIDPTIISDLYSEHQELQPEDVPKSGFSSDEENHSSVCSSPALTYVSEWDIATQRPLRSASNSSDTTTPCACLGLQRYHWDPHHCWDEKINRTREVGIVPDFCDIKPLPPSLPRRPADEQAAKMFVLPAIQT